jgi:hypothetical protein
MENQQEKKVPVNAKKFTYEIIISKGTGRLTRRAENMIIALGTNAIRKKIYFRDDDMKDCLQTAFFNMLSNWHNFNPDKSDNAFSYFTEIFKRSITEMYNELYKKKGLKPEEQKLVKLISINSVNSGNGMYNV